MDKSRRKFKVLIFTAIILGLGTLNVLTLINEQVHMGSAKFFKTILNPFLSDMAISHLMSRSPSEKYAALDKSNKILASKHVELKSKYVELKKVSDARSQVVKRITTRVARRAVVNAGKNAASYVAELIPFASIVAITTLTASDIYDDCQTLKDLNELSVVFQHEKSDQSKLCGVNIP